MTDLDDQDATRRREETDVGENNESQSQLVWPKSKSLLGDTTFNPDPREKTSVTTVTLTPESRNQTRSVSQRIPLSKPALVAVMMSLYLRHLGV